LRRLRNFILTFFDVGGSSIAVDPERGLEIVGLIGREECGVVRIYFGCLDAMINCVPMLEAVYQE